MQWKNFHSIKKPIIENYIDETIKNLAPEGILREAMLYSISAGGKRLRPFFAILTANLLNKKEKAVYPYAAALEMIHTYSLIHDDLPAMDNDDMRRGKPSCHKAFSEDIAILAGDSLLTDAFKIIFSSELNPEGGKYLADAAGSRGMVLGQILDCKTQTIERNIESLDIINTLKTSKLIMASLAGAAAALDSTSEEIGILETYGMELGLAFQITDDILDITAEESELGKPVGSDAQLGKITYPALLGIEKAEEEAKKHVDKAIKAISELPENKYRQMLIEIAEYMIGRRS